MFRLIRFGVQKLQAAESVVAALCLTCISSREPPRTSKVIFAFSTATMPTSATPRLLNGPGLYARHKSRGGNVDQPAIYKYEPLRDRNDIRLLKFRPGKLGDIIRADLETVGVRAGRHYYDAISYTWADENGDATKCCSLKIGSPGLLLPITRNCDSVLRRVHKYTDRVWIDAVCIDQDNVRERGHQVDLMPRIYKSAVRTFAYVGEASVDSDLVLRNLAKGIWTPPHLLDPFFARPYFSRVWVVQEVALSKSIAIVCGDTAVEWTGLMQGEYLRQIYTSSYYETFPTLFRLGRQHYLGVANLLDALLLGRSCNASDPRDKVFALLGIVSEESRLPANYSLSTAEVYTQIAMHLLKGQQWGLDVILGNLCHRSHESRIQIKDLPSWVPDWNQGGPKFLERVPQALEFLESQKPIFEDNDGTGLFLEGQIVGTLETLNEHPNFIGITVLHLFNSRTDVNLFNSRSRESRELPRTYGDRRLYVFFVRDIISQNQWPLMEWKDRGLPNSILQTLRVSEYVFLVAHPSDGESAETNLSAQRKGESQESLEACGGAEDGSRSFDAVDATPRKASEEPRDGRSEANSFALLGLLEVVLTLLLSEVASRMNPFGDKYQTKYATTTPCTIRIV